jgi:hypothetical protein
MDGKDIVKLAAEFAAGGITADAISEQYGEGVLSTILAIAGGTVAGAATGVALDVLDEYTGVVSGVGSVIDDITGWF